MIRARQITVMASTETTHETAAVVDIPREDSLGSNGHSWLLSSANAYNTETCGCQPDACSGRELIVGMRLLVATFFCLLWNITGVVIVMTCSRYYVRNSESRDMSKVLTVVLAAVPFLCVGSILLWLVLVEWCKHLRTFKFRASVTSQYAKEVSENPKAEVLKSPPLAVGV